MGLIQIILAANVLLTWTPPSADPQRPVSGYVVRYADQELLVSGSANAVAVSHALDVETCFRIFAVNSSGESPPSNEVCRAPTILPPFPPTDLTVEVLPDEPTPTPLPGACNIVGPQSLEVVDNFDNGAASSFWSNCQNCNFENGAIKWSYDSNEDSGKLVKNGLEFDSIYIEFDQKYSTGVQAFAGNTLKQFRVYHTSGNQPVNFNAELHGDELNISYLDSAPDRDRNFREVSGSAGEWHRVRIYLSVNATGERNGTLKVWWNGANTYDRSDIEIVRQGVKPNGVWIGGNLSGGNPNAPFDRFIDNVRVVVEPNQECFE